MGFTLTDRCCEDLNTPQAPGNVIAVRWRAGWTAAEVAKELHIPARVVERAEEGLEPMPKDVWINFLKLCGRRVFDDEA